MLDAEQVVSDRTQQLGALDVPAGTDIRAGDACDRRVIRVAQGLRHLPPEPSIVVAGLALPADEAVDQVVDQLGRRAAGRLRLGGQGIAQVRLSSSTVRDAALGIASPPPPISAARSRTISAPASASPRCP